MRSNLAFRILCITVFFYLTANTVESVLTYDNSDTPDKFAPRVGNEFIIEFVKVNGLLDLRINGQSQVSLWKGDSGPLDFYFNVTNTYSTDPGYTTTFVHDFSITTPDACGIAAPCTSGTPEPASWALLITGFGLTGAAMRRRRTRIA